MKIAEQDVLKQFAADKDLMTMLTLIRSLRLKDSWLAAGLSLIHIYEIVAFLNGIDEKHDYIKVILTGAGTSAYVGDTLVPYFKEVYDERKWNFNAIATTDIVANPETYLKKDVATVLVSFARSGNSPESVATVDLAKALVEMCIRDRGNFSPHSRRNR